MERLSDKAIEIINDLHTERLDYTSEYLPLIEVAQKLASYEDTGIGPEEVTELMAAHGTAILDLSEYRQLGPKKHLQELAQAEKDGRLVVLPSKDYCWRIRGDIFLNIIRANCRAAHEEAEAELKKRGEADDEAD